MKVDSPTPNVEQSEQSEEGEFLIINRLLKTLSEGRFAVESLQGEPGLTSQGLIGPGDDAAVIPSVALGNFSVVSVDAFIEGRHFLSRLSSPEEIGYKALCTAVSDIAAMGGEAKFIFIDLHLPQPYLGMAEGYYRGIRRFSEEFQVVVLGGNLSSSSELSFSITVIGSTVLPPLLRSGARPGGDLWVSGSPGLSHLGLLSLLQERPIESSGNTLLASLERYHRPVPRLAFGKELLQIGATSAIDISDGLFQDAVHIAHRSRCSLRIDLQALALEGISETFLVELLAGGGDYELLFSAPVEKREQIRNLGIRLGIETRRCGLVEADSKDVEVLVETSKGALALAQLRSSFGLVTIGNNHFPRG